jgi:hypothetical protein
MGMYVTLHPGKKWDVWCKEKGKINKDEGYGDDGD